MNGWQAGSNHLDPGPARLRALPSDILDRTDLGNAALFARLHSDTLKFVVDQHRWIAWDGRRWGQAEDGALIRAAKDVVAELLHDAGQLSDADQQKRAVAWAIQSASAKGLAAMLKLAAAEMSVEVRSSDLDQHAHLLSVRNGLIDLRTGDLEPHDQAQFITRFTDIDYVPNARAPRWDRFLGEIFSANADLIAFIQRAAGHTLTGDVREDVLFICFGSGRNGKRIFMEALARLLGDAAKGTPMATFTSDGKNRSAPTNDLAALCGARMVSASESDSDVRLSEALVKALTGNDPITARFHFKEFFTYRPTFKIWLATNKKPRIRGTDAGIWSRIRLIPFRVSFAGREDRLLDAALRREESGILAWAVRGAVEWYRDGLGMAQAVQQATDAYRDEQDILGPFIEDRLVLSPESRISRKQLIQLYVVWCESAHEKGIAPATLYRIVGEREGVEETKVAGVRSFKGIGAKVVPS